jgi:DNA modification methylase
MLNINTIYNMDFRQGFKDLPKFDMIITDPPYNINFKYDKYSDKMDFKEYVELIAEFKNLPLAIIHYPEETMKYIVPSIGVPDEIVVWCYNSNIGRQSRLINFYNCNVDFNKVKQPYKNPTDKRVKKLIEKGSDGTRLYDWFSDIQIVKNVSKEKTIHPCPVPIKLMERIILLTTKVGDTVIDPFMGCGTTALACINTNRNFIGFEISENYCYIANERINKT